MIDHACTGLDCPIKDNCQRYELHLKTKAPANQGICQWYIMPDPKDCSCFVEKYDAKTRDNPN